MKEIKYPESISEKRTTTNLFIYLYHTYVPWSKERERGNFNYDNVDSQHQQAEQVEQQWQQQERCVAEVTTRQQVVDTS